MPALNTHTPIDLRFWPWRPYTGPIVDGRTTPCGPATRIIRECRQNQSKLRSGPRCQFTLLLQILSVFLFEKVPIQRAFSDPASQSECFQTDNELSLLES